VPAIGLLPTRVDVPVRTVRFRITAIAVAAVVVVLVIVGVVLVQRQRAALIASLDQTLIRRADDIVAGIEEAGIPGQFASVGGEGFVQLVSGTGTVIASTLNLAGEPALDLPQRTGADFIGTVSGLSVDDDVFRFLSRSLGDEQLYVATTFDVVAESTAALAGSLGLTVPIVVLFVAGLVWWLVGRTLEPVETIRTEVASIGSEDLSKRVPAPGTGDEIDRLAATMNQMLERLENSIDRQQRFVADASHELRIPLTRLRSELEMMLALAGEETDREGLSSLLEETISMQAMVQDLLYLARLEANMGIKAVPVDLDDIVLEQLGSIEATNPVEVRLGDFSAVLVRGDRRQLSRALANLLHNAQRHATGEIRVSLSESNGEAVLSVEDDGPGVPVDAAAHIFERFGRVDEARTADAGGTGLGLAIARDIVERHGGRLVLANAGQPGARFEIHLPI
jgi:signal transduction histidine kinase